ncbi:hypothetical protein [Streptomyces sp. NP160]|uniref:hypothetical protein n=1 Tax=Streptomyces sp. NP160 TaxID=2586637 RepID=UPI0015D65E91|nr:hypothetical protein [Streptomyces sp. NP160]
MISPTMANAASHAWWPQSPHLTDRTAIVDENLQAPMKPVRPAAPRTLVVPCG